MILLTTLLLFQSAVLSDAWAGQGTVCLDADRQVKYADGCFAAHDYETAESEYRRFVYFFPKDERVLQARFNIGLCLFHLKDFSAALGHFTVIFDHEGFTPTGIESGWMISRCYQRMGNDRAAIDNLIYITRLTGDPVVLDKAWHQIGWLYLESGDLVQARAAFNRITPTGHLSNASKTLNVELGLMADMPRKSPMAAGILSLVPGGGYLYCGRYQDALIAFFFTGAFVCGAVESFDKDLHAIGGMMSLISLGFYGGNIYGGINSAHKFNQARHEDAVSGLKKKMGYNVSACLMDRGLSVCVAFRF